MTKPSKATKSVRKNVPPASHSRAKSGHQKSLEGLTEDEYRLLSAVVRELRERRQLLGDQSGEQRPVPDFARVIEAVCRISSWDLGYVVTLATILNTHRGSSSPEETLIKKLVLSYQYFPLNPEGLERAVSEFKEDYSYAMGDAIAFVRRHPEVLEGMKEPTPESGGEDD